ncbi:MAG: hypothetical protein IT324_30620 [Anaerolineae bacterium]|nr:hypothetical protein [Anaerolineae bacterium]
MPLLGETITDLTKAVTARRQSLDDALVALQQWVDHNAPLMTQAERDAFSETLEAEKDAAPHEGEPYSSDAALISSVLRLHAMRLLYRVDERRHGSPLEQPDPNSPYERARYKLQVALRETELAINEGRMDVAVANAHHILNNRGANRRWLQDALARVQTVASKDLIKLAESVPAPEPPPINILQRLMFLIFGIKQDEIIRRNMRSLRQLAELQHTQLLELAKLLADSFEAVGDRPGAKQAKALVERLEGMVESQEGVQA